MTDLNNLAVTNHSAWLSTAASQIFFMELGFLCLEAGYVQTQYTQSLVIKNIEDIFFGFTTYVCFGYAIVTYNYEFIALYNLPYAQWDTIFVNAAYAATAATIMSGAVLERISNAAYSLYVFFIILINYSFISSWIWEKDGWLFKLGFIDCAGCSAVHMIGGIGGLILCIFLGPRFSSLKHINDPLANKTKMLKEKDQPSNLLVMITGTLILWYGWIAFNVSSEIVADIGIGGDVGLAGLLTVILPSCSSASTFMLTYAKWPNWIWIRKRGIKPGTPIIERSAENLSTAILSGLVVVTACCYTINLITAIIVGFIIPFPVFIVSYYLRTKWCIDDPLDVISIHLIGGIIGLLVEGLCNINNGLLTTGQYKHFLVQIIGIVVTLVFNIVADIIWLLILKYIIFRKSGVKATPLSICLRTSKHDIYKMDYKLAFRELMFCDTNFSKAMMVKFHKYLKKIYCDEQLDFIIAVYQYRKLFNKCKTKTNPSIISVLMHTPTTPTSKIISMTKSEISNTVNVNTPNSNCDIINKQILHAFISVCNLYILNDTLKQINISSNMKKKIKIVHDKINHLKIDCNSYQSEINEIDKTIFNDAFMDTLKLTLINLKVFLQEYHHSEWKTEKKYDKKLYVLLNDSWNIQWFHDQNDKNNTQEIKPKNKKQTRRHISDNYIQAASGRIKHVDDEIDSLLR